MTAVSVSGDIVGLGFRRGDYIRIEQSTPPARTAPLGMFASYVPAIFPSVRSKHSSTVRIVNLNATTATTRAVARFKAVEWCRRRVEDRILWPLADLKAKMKTKV